MYKLTGINGNAFSVMGYVRTCMKKEKKSKEEIATYTEKAMSGDYDNLLCVSMDILDELNNK